MHNDIVIEVIDKIKSGKPILVMQAILTGIEAKITDEAFIEEIKNNALFKKIVALGYLIQQKYHNDIRNMLP